MRWNKLKNTIIYQDQKLILMSKNELNNNKFVHKTIFEEKYFWEIAAVNPVKLPLNHFVSIIITMN